MLLAKTFLPVLLLAPSLLAQRFPEVEPNNTVGAAQAIAVSTQIDASLSPAVGVPLVADTDWYSFTLTGATRIRIHTTGVDTRIALLNAAGTTALGIDDDQRGGAQAFASDITLNIAAGSYTVLVTPFSTGDFGPYSIEVAEITPVAYTGSEIEPNDTFLTATPTALPSGGGAARYLGNVGPATLQLASTVPGPGASVLASAVAAPTVAASNSVLSTTATVITVVTPIVASAYIGTVYAVLMTSGANTGVERQISSNTATTITTTAFPVANVPTDTFDIVYRSSTTVTLSAVPLVASAYATGHAVVMTSGLNVGLLRAITANTVDRITTAAWPVANSFADTFDIVPYVASTTGLIQSTTALTAALWNPPVAGFGRFYVRFTSGLNAGLSRQISANTATSITCSTFPTVPSPGDAFVVELVDVDYYQVVLTAPQAGLWFQINEGDAPWVFGHRYEVYDSAGVLVVTTTLGTNAANCSTLSPRTSQVRVWPAGTYHLAVRSPTAPFTAPAVMPGVLVPLGNYMLELFHMPLDTGATVVEAIEPNNTTLTATPFTFGQIGQGNVSISGGLDPSDWWGPIVISSPSTITYQTRQGLAPAMTDTTINLRDINGAIALTSTLGNILSPTSHARGVVSFFLTPATYYLEVLSPGTTVATQSGNYELQLSAIIPAPYVAASYTVLGSNAICGSVLPRPTLTRQFPSEVPALGSLFARQIINCPPSAIFFHMVGWSETLPALDMSPKGAPDCTWNVNLEIFSFGLASPLGVVELADVVPGSIALRGALAFEQAVVASPAANTWGGVLTPHARFLLGERTY